LEKLNAGDYQGAAAEFDRWIHAEENGVKVPLPGLITRRAKEKKLFSQSNGS